MLPIDKHLCYNYKWTSAREQFAQNACRMLTNQNGFCAMQALESKSTSIPDGANRAKILNYANTFLANTVISGAAKDSVRTADLIERRLGPKETKLYAMEWL